MIGAMISKIRKDKKFSKTDIAKLIGIDTGHLTHIEKGERKPSVKIIKQICKVCDLPYQPLMYSYDKDLPKSKIRPYTISNLSFSKILAINDINCLSNFIDCPTHKPSASLAIKITDDAMLNTFDTDSYVYIELNVALEHNDIGLFQCDGKFLIRRLVFNSLKNEPTYFTLKADNPAYPDIRTDSLSEFYMVGRVIQ